MGCFFIQAFNVTDGLEDRIGTHQIGLLDKIKKGIQLPGLMLEATISRLVIAFFCPGLAHEPGHRILPKAQARIHRIQLILQQLLRGARPGLCQVDHRLTEAKGIKQIIGGLAVLSFRLSGLFLGCSIIHVSLFH